VLAVEAWPSQAKRKHLHVLAPELALENLHEDVWASALAYFDATTSRGGSATGSGRNGSSLG
jgi:hypothetical protein